MELGTIAIVIAIVFIVYRLGLVKFTQANIGRVTKTTDAALELMELRQGEVHTKAYGKLDKKLNDTSIKRSTAKDIRKLLKTAGQTTTA